LLETRREAILVAAITRRGGAALSIVFVASEIVHTRQGRYSVTQHYPCVVAFTFAAF